MRGTPSRGAVAAVAAALALTLASPAAGAPGDVFVADEDAAAGGNGVIFRIGPAGGAATAVASSAALLPNPGGMVMDRSGRLIVADYEASAILRVNPRTGAVSIVAQGGDLDAPWDVALGADGKIYAIGYTTPPHLYRVSPGSGAVQILATGSGEWNSGHSVAVARDGTIYFTDNDEEVFRRDPVTGEITTIADAPEIPAGADGLQLAADERHLYLVVDAGPPTSPLMRIELSSGAVSTFATVTQRFIDLAALPSGGFLLANTTVGAGSIQRVGPAGGIPTDFSTDPDLSVPHGIVAEPSRCAGRVPTVVGTIRRDVIRGSRFADVISTLGGRDLVRGLGRKDIVCGGRGPDRLFGGAGRDLLFGGPGRDRLIGGNGQDRLRGGPGRDVERQ